MVIGRPLTASCSLQFSLGTGKRAFVVYGTGTAADCLPHLPLRLLYLNQNQLSCVPLTAPKLSAILSYQGPSTICVSSCIHLSFSCSCWRISSTIYVFHVDRPFFLFDLQSLVADCESVTMHGLSQAITCLACALWPSRPQLCVAWPSACNTAPSSIPVSPLSCDHSLSMLSV